MVDHESRRLVERFYNDMWNHADEDVARTILSPDLEFRGSIGELRRGTEGFIGYMRKIHAAFADYRCRIDDLIATGDRAAAQMMFTGIHRGSLSGEAPTGKAIGWAGAAFFTMGDRRITRIWVLGDTESLKRALGLLPQGGPGG
jgi:predicted ester cyclase